MINFHTITKAIRTQLANDAAVSAFMNREITIGEYINVDPDIVPWMGIYRGKVTYTPRTLGVNASSWEATPQVRIIVQATSFKSGEDCELLLEDYVEKTIDAIWADPTIGNTVDMLVGYEVEYGYNETDRETIYFQSAIITLDLEAKTS